MATLVQTGSIAMWGNGHIVASTAAFTDTTDSPFSNAGSLGDVTNNPKITVAGAGTSGADLVTTISAFVSTSAVTLAASSGTTVTGQGWAWGTVVGTTNGATGTQLKMTYASAQNAGDAICVHINLDPAQTITSITDTSGNSYKLVGTTTNTYAQATYVALGIAAAFAAANTLTVVFSATVAGFSSISFAEYTPTPGYQFAVDQYKGGTGTGTAVTTGNFTTKYAVSAMFSETGLALHATAGAGGGWSTSNPDTFGDISQSEIVSSIQTGIAVTATQNSSAAWGIVVVTLGEAPVSPNIVAVTNRSFDVALPPPTSLFAGVVPPAVGKAALIQPSRFFDPVAMPPVASLDNGQSGGIVGGFGAQITTGKGQAAQPPAIFESPLAIGRGPFFVDLPPFQGLENGQSGGSVGAFGAQVTTGFGQPTQAAALVLLQAFSAQFVGLPPQDALLAGGPPTFQGIVPPIYKPTLYRLPDLAIEQFEKLFAGVVPAAGVAVIVAETPTRPVYPLPPSGNIVAGSGKAAQPPVIVVGPIDARGPVLTTTTELLPGFGQAAQVGVISIAPPDARNPWPTTTSELLSGFGNAAQPPVIVVGPPDPRSPVLTTTPRLMTGAGQAAQVAMIFAPFDPRAPWPMGSSELLAGAAAVAPTPLFMTAVADPRAPWPTTVPSLLVGSGQAAQPPVIVTGVPDARAPWALPPLDELLAGSSFIPLVKAYLTVPPDPRAPVPTVTPELLIGSGQAAQPPVILESFPAAQAILPPSQAYYAGFGQAAQVAVIVAGPPDPRSPWPTATAEILTGSGKAAQPPVIVVGAADPRAPWVTTVPELLAGGNAPASAAAVIVAETPTRPPVALPPTGKVIAGAGQAAQPAQIVTAPTDPRPPWPIGSYELLAGVASAQATVAVLVTSPSDPRSPWPTTTAELLAGFGKAAQSPVIITGPPDARSPVPTTVGQSLPGVIPPPPPTGVIVVGPVDARSPWPSASAELVAGFGKPAQVPVIVSPFLLPPFADTGLPPVTAIYAGFGQPAQAVTLFVSPFDPRPSWPTTPLPFFFTGQHAPFADSGPFTFVDAFAPFFDFEDIQITIDAEGNTVPLGVNQPVRPGDDVVFQLTITQWTPIGFVPADPPNLMFTATCEVDGSIVTATPVRVQQGQWYVIASFPIGATSGIWRRQWKCSGSAPGQNRNYDRSFFVDSSS